MKEHLVRKNIIEVIFFIYVLIAFSLYFYINSLSFEKLLLIQDILKEYHFVEGGYTYLAIEYSKILNHILSMCTLCFSIILIKYRKVRKHERRIDTIPHYVFVIVFIIISSYFLWIKEWKLFSSNDYNYIKEIPMFIIIICGLHAMFISEFWYFIDMLEKLYKNIVNKQDE